ncbi:Pentatricopeptide repeat-containing protein [Vitis vinifera]|uniref:Pentatricopeptide repeat-containing protein n=1 Tax=Vitis vinifera TaxID=29760 RepID=A0A438F2C6_VITVI|nr:Pentatricopeptide repeat-containing protein [Vitis vinifera]
MSAKRATLLTINSLTALSKQNPDGLYGGNSMNSSEVHQDLNPRGYREYARNEFKQNPFSQSGNFSRNYRQGSGGLPANQNELCRESTINEYQQNLVGQSGNINGSESESEWNCQQIISETLGDLNRTYGENIRQFQQSQVDIIEKIYSSISQVRICTIEKMLVNINRTQMLVNISRTQILVNISRTQMLLNISRTQMLLNISRTKCCSYQTNSNEFQNSMVGSPKSSNYKPDGESLEAAESSQYSGTLEEVDDFCKDGKVKEAIEVLGLLEKQHTPVDLPRYLRLMKACGEAKALQEAKAVHESLIKSVSPLKNDLGEEAIDLFIQFKESGLKPDGLWHCSINEALCEYGGHAGNSGYLDEALEFVEKMPLEPSVDVWETLMNICRVQGNMEIGDRCAELVEHLEPSRLTEQSKAGLVPVKASDLEKEKEKRNWPVKIF